MVKVSHQIKCFTDMSHTIHVVGIRIWSYKRVTFYELFIFKKVEKNNYHNTQYTSHKFGDMSHIQCKSTNKTYILVKTFLTSILDLTVVWHFS